MTEPTVLTTVTADSGTPKSGILSRITGKMPTLLWVVVAVLVAGLVLMFMWQRGDRMALINMRKNQMQYVRTQDCAAMIEESIAEYDRQRHQLAEPRVTEQTPTCLEEAEEDETSSDDEEDEDSLSEEEEEEEEDDDEAPSPPPSPPPDSK